ncbi:DciA family protein [Verrucomicrobiota bacterium]
MEPNRKPKFDPDRWQLQKQRLRLNGHKPPAPLREIKRMGSVLDKVFEELGINNLKTGHQFESSWADTVGKQVAKHARPGKCINGVLTVYVDHPTWMNELSRFGKKAMLFKLQKKHSADEIKDITFRPDPGK